MASGEYFPMKIEPAFLTPFNILLLIFVFNSKCSGAIILIICVSLFLLLVKIANPKFFKL